MRTISVVTTCNSEGYNRYGRAMMATFDKYVTQRIPLFIYHEGFVPDLKSNRFCCIDIEESCPDLNAFKMRHKTNPRANGLIKNKYRIIVQWDKPRIKIRRNGDDQSFRWDAIRFSHKVFAICHAATICNSDILVWMDADMVIHTDIDDHIFSDCVPDDCLVSCLKRHHYSECSFVGFNLKNNETKNLLDEFRNFYTTDDLFKEREYHDSFLFDVVRRRFERAGHRTHDIAQGAGFERGPGHVFEKSILGQYMEHLKGRRKEQAAPVAMASKLTATG